MSHDAHGEKNDSIIKIAFNMMMACLVSGAVIAGVYACTAEDAKKTREQSEEKARVELVKKYVKDVKSAKFESIDIKNNFEFKFTNIGGKEEVVKVEGEGEGEKGEKWFKVMEDGKQVAYIVPTSYKGYEGIIEMLAAIDMDGKVISYKILSHRETPGLGDGALKDDFIKQFKGKGVEGLKVVKVPDDTKIQALTGATITTRAVTNGMKKAVDKVAEYEKTQKK